MNRNPPNAPSRRRFALEERYESLIIKQESDKCCNNDNNDNNGNCEINCECSNLNSPQAKNSKNKKNSSNNVGKNKYIQECIIF